MDDERTTWQEVRTARMAEPGAQGAYEAARLAFELGATVRTLLEEKGLESRPAGPGGGDEPA